MGGSARCPSGSGHHGHLALCFEGPRLQATHVDPGAKCIAAIVPLVPVERVEPRFESCLCECANPAPLQVEDFELDVGRQRQIESDGRASRERIRLILVQRELNRPWDQRLT